MLRQAQRVRLVKFLLLLNIARHVVIVVAEDMHPRDAAAFHRLRENVQKRFQLFK